MCEGCARDGRATSRSTQPRKATTDTKRSHHISRTPCLPSPVCGRPRAVCGADLTRARGVGVRWPRPQLLRLAGASQNELKAKEERRRNNSGKERARTQPSAWSASSLPLSWRLSGLSSASLSSELCRAGGQMAVDVHTQAVPCQRHRIQQYVFLVDVAFQFSRVRCVLKSAEHPFQMTEKRS
jgi:hypothetical protein